MATVVVPREYGYVVLVAVGSTFMLVWKGVMVSVIFLRAQLFLRLGLVKLKKDLTVLQSFNQYPNHKF